MRLLATMLVATLAKTAKAMHGLDSRGRSTLGHSERGQDKRSNVHGRNTQYQDDHVCNAHGHNERLVRPQQILPWFTRHNGPSRNVQDRDDLSCDMHDHGNHILTLPRLARPRVQCWSWPGRTYDAACACDSAPPAARTASITAMSRRVASTKRAGVDMPDCGIPSLLSFIRCFCVSERKSWN